MQNGTVSKTCHIYNFGALMLKEILRATKFIARSIRRICRKIFMTFPEFMRRPIFSMVKRLDQITDEVDRKTSNVMHQYLDPNIARDSNSATLSKIIVHDNASVIFAKLTYDNLKLIVKHFSAVMEIEEKFFISEMLSARAYQKSAAQFNSVEQDEIKAGMINSTLLHQGVIRTQRSLNAANSPDKEIKKLAEISCFANMLWLVVVRDYVPEHEEDLFYACCDLSYVIAEQIEEAGDDYQKLGELLKTHAEII